MPTCKIRIGLGQKKNSGSVLACPHAIRIGPPKKGDDHCVRNRHVHIGSYLLSIYLHLKNPYSYRLRRPAPLQKKHSKKTNLPVSKPKKIKYRKKMFPKKHIQGKKNQTLPHPRFQKKYGKKSLRKKDTAEKTVSETNSSTLKIISLQRTGSLMETIEEKLRNLIKCCNHIKK